MKGPSNDRYFSLMEDHLRMSEIELSQPAEELVRNGIGQVRSKEGKLPPLDNIVQIAGDWASRGIVPADTALRGLAYIQGIKPYGPDYDAARMQLHSELPTGGE